MDNKEEILEALEEFAKHPGGKISHVLEQYLSRIAATGVTVFPWTKLKPLLIHKLDSVVQEFQERSPMSQQSPSPNIEHVTFEVMRKRLIDDIDQFNGIPFTIQRLCELVTNPTKHYQKTDKYMRGVEKNLVVVTTVDPFGNRIVNENKVEMNGIEALSTHDHLCQTDSLNSSFLPPVPVNSPTTSSGTGSWFSSLSNVVDSPSSYPNWSNQETTAEVSTEKRVSVEKSDCLEPPRKVPRLAESSGEAGGDVDEASDASQLTEGGSEQKAIAPLLTQLLNNSNAMEQVRTVQEQAETSQTESAMGTTEEPVRASDKVEPIESSSIIPVTTAEKQIYAMENSSDSPAAAGDACDSTMACSNFSADENSNPETSGENRFSESDADRAGQTLAPKSIQDTFTASDERALVTTQSIRQDSLNSSADSSGLQTTKRDYDVRSVKQDPAKSDLAVAQPTVQEWSSQDDSSGNIDSASNGDSDCGVDSLLETSDMNVSFADAESGDFSDNLAQREACEQEGTSEAQMAVQQGSDVSDTDVASQRQDRELEQVGSSHWESSSPSPMDAE